MAVLDLFSVLIFKLFYADKILCLSRLNTDRVVQGGTEMLSRDYRLEGIIKVRYFNFVRTESSMRPVLDGKNNFGFDI